MTRLKTVLIWKWKMRAILLRELLFAEDMVIVAEIEENLQFDLNEYQRVFKKMEINAIKCKITVIANEGKNIKLK